MLDQFFRTDEAIVEDHMRGNAQFLRQRLQPFSIFLAFRPPDMWMRCSGDDVNHVFMLFKNSWKGADHIFDTLVWREQPERKQHRFPLCPKQVLEIIGICEWKVRHA